MHPKDINLILVYGLRFGRRQIAHTASRAPRRVGATAIRTTAPLWKFWEWITGISAQGFFNFITAIATGVIAWFTSRLVDVTSEMKAATAEAAKAASDAARIANLALHADRPLIIVQEIGMVPSEKELSLSPRVIFRNYGRSPAILLEVYLGLETYTGDAIQLSDEIVNRWNFTRHNVQTQVIAAGDIANELITVKFLHPKVFAEVMNKETAQVAHGLIRYRGAFELTEPYESRFCWFYIPPYDNWPNGYFVIGPKELNKST